MPIRTMYRGFILICLLSMQSNAWAELYRWVDDNGKVHYSDKIPPERAHLGHSELSKTGLKLKEVAKAKSASQFEEEKWLKALEKKHKERLAEQQRADRQLLNNYPSLKKLDAFYAKRFSDMKKNRLQLKHFHAKLMAQKATLQSELKKAKTKNGRDRVQGFIDKVDQNLRSYQDAITQSRKDEEKAEGKFMELRERYSLVKQRYENKLKPLAKE